MAYAILRAAKLKSYGNIGGSSSHNFRERQTLNADPERTPSNITSGAQSTKEVIAAVKARLETVPTVRKNAVLAVEYFIGMSPEFVKEGGNIKGYFDAAEKWLKEKHGAANVVAITRQFDETTPHICAYVVPIDPKGKLNCSHFLDGRTKLSEMQTAFAEEVGRQFGLERGIEGSQAKHQTIKQYYAQIQAPTPELKTQIPEVPAATTSQKMAEAVGISTDHSRALAQQEAAKKRRAAEYRSLREAEQAKAKQYDIEKDAQQARAARLSELRANATQARDLPLALVLERLGCTPDPNDKKNWRTPAGRISVNGSKFYAHDLAKGGGGAIDLVMLVEETDYADAVNRLAQDFGTGAVLAQVFSTIKPAIESAAKAPPQPYRAPEPKPENWPKVRQYLTGTRLLSGQLVDRLHELGKVYSDRYSNAVFVLGKGVGVELRGTGEKPFHGVRGEKAPFIMADRGEKKVAFVESSIDAISLWELGFKGCIVSTSGNSAALTREMAEDYRDQGFTIFAAFDNDNAGEQMSVNLGYPRERIYPEGKDWNEDLCAERAERQEQDRLDREQQDEGEADDRPGPSSFSPC